MNFYSAKMDENEYIVVDDYDCDNYDIWSEVQIVLLENDRLLCRHKGNYQKVGIDYLFPDEKKVLAEWFSGKIRIPHGEMMKYIHQGYASLYEKELFLEIEKGFVVGQYEIDNTHLYNDKAGMKTRNMDDLIEAIFGIKPQKRNSIFRKIFERFSIWGRKK